MKLDELDFAYPDRLVAVSPAAQTRAMVVAGESRSPREISRAQDALLEIPKDDLLVINETRVLKRRVFSSSGLEILFIRSFEGDREWEILCPSSRWRDGEEQVLPGDVRLELTRRGRPQLARASRAIDAAYFELHGEMPVPPYVQKARGERRNRAADAEDYQTEWARHDGSLAAPTASLHFSQKDLDAFVARGGALARVTLHVGLGTFLPVTASDLADHVMHAEEAEISAEAARAIDQAKARGARVWAMGTTVARTLESAAHGLLEKTTEGGYRGATDLFIRPGFRYKAVDALLTNFHHPKSTLLALVAAFAPGGIEQTRACYAWAIAHEYNLFSYGDLTVWIR